MLAKVAFCKLSLQEGIFTSFFNTANFINEDACENFKACVAFARIEFVERNAGLNFA